MDVNVQPLTDINDANVLLQLRHGLDSNTVTEENHMTDLSETNPILYVDSAEQTSKHNNVGDNKSTMASEEDHATNLSDGNEFLGHNETTGDYPKDQRCFWYPYCQKMARICGGWRETSCCDFKQGGQYYHRVDTDEKYAEFLVAKENACKILQRERVRTHRQKKYKAQEPKGTTTTNKRKKGMYPLHHLYYSSHYYPPPPPYYPPPYYPPPYYPPPYFPPPL